MQQNKRHISAIEFNSFPTSLHSTNWLIQQSWFWFTRITLSIRILFLKSVINFRSFVYRTRAPVNLAKAKIWKSSDLHSLPILIPHSISWNFSAPTKIAFPLLASLLNLTFADALISYSNWLPDEYRILPPFPSYRQIGTQSSFSGSRKNFHTTFASIIMHIPSSLITKH